MATEIDALRDQNRRLREALRWRDSENFLKYAVVQCVAPLITEYEKHLEALNGQLKYYQKQMGEMKLQLENVIKENE
uniref:Sodium channel and clathrin linker 1 n=1 Tax=Propithecus coquereli TaxID=379532 RepID=A0A2K6G105_PROCO